MSRADVAEWILSLTTSRDHAASIAGDLAQQAPQYGSRWFWASLLRTLVSLTWRAFTEAPFRMAGLAFVALLLQTAYMVGIGLCVAFMHLAFGLYSLRSNFPPGIAEVGFDVATFFPRMLEAIAVFLVTSYFTGKWIARRAPQRELTVYVAVWFLVHLMWIPLQFLASGGVRILPSLPEVAADLLGTVGGFLFAFAGVRRVRRRQAMV